MTSKQTEFSYRNITLYKSQSLGSGSYGGVCKARCDGLLCAAKIMHPTLFDLHDPGSASYLAKFQEECRLLSLARHPNVVQYLATDCDPDTRLPVLLMELCDESLTAFLERSPGPLSYHIQVNIVYDIALALVYLHCNGVIHRDLTGNNILMIAGPRAKITDFGMSKLATVNPRMTALTLCPGNVLYMSPEALDEAKSYTAKLDMFSFGVITIQMLTRQFPNPTDRFRLLRVPGVNQEVRVLVPDAERRKDHLESIPQTNPLKHIAVISIEKEESKRPSAIELSERLAELKQSSRYTESVRRAQNLSYPHEQQQNQPPSTNDGPTNGTPEEKLTKLGAVVEKQKSEIMAKDEAIEKTEEELARQTLAIELKEKELHCTEEKLQVSKKLVFELRQNQERMEKCLQEKDNKIADFQKLLSEHKREIPESTIGIAIEQPQQPPPDTPQATPLKEIREMSWREGKRAPEKMNRGAAAVKGNSVYIAPVNSHIIYHYQYMEGDEKWFCLASSPNKNVGLAMIEGLVTTVGGARGSSVTRSLLSLTREGKWFEVFQPMPTPRTSPVCITSDKTLVVAGGDDLNTVEVMKMSTQQWITVSSLPQQYSLLSGTLCGDTLYLAGGIANDMDDSKTSSKSVLACTLSNLEPPGTLFATLRKAVTRNRDVWREISGLPVAHSTLVSFRSQLLAVGGWDDFTNPTANVYRYDSRVDSWSVVSRMRRERSFCHAAVVSQDTLIVVGGYEGRTMTNTDTTEVLH